VPPRRFSRYQYSAGILDAGGHLLLTDPMPFGFVALADNVVHTVESGDTLWGLAHTYFQPLARPSGLWWVIADFQPPPIYDPTVALVAGSTIYVPSVRTVLELLFNASRQQTSG
jgi:hypothetical protein